MAKPVASHFFPRKPGIIFRALTYLAGLSELKKYETFGVYTQKEVRAGTLAHQGYDIRFSETAHVGAYVPRSKLQFRRNGHSPARQPGTLSETTERTRGNDYHAGRVFVRPAV